MGTDVIAKSHIHIPIKHMTENDIQLFSKRLNEFELEILNNEYDIAIISDFYTNCSKDQLLTNNIDFYNEYVYRYGRDEGEDFKHQTGKLFEFLEDVSSELSHPIVYHQLSIDDYTLGDIDTVTSDSNYYDIENAMCVYVEVGNFEAPAIEHIKLSDFPKIFRKVLETK